jgi:hypothetical protein
MPPGFADGVDNDHTYTAGPGLTLSGDAFAVNFAGTGSATSAARSDHGHFGAFWEGDGDNGLEVYTASSTPGAGAIFGVAGVLAAVGSAGVVGYNSGSGNGVAGYASQSAGVWGLHNTFTGAGPGVEGETLSTTGEAVGVRGIVDSTSPGSFSAGVRGINNGTGPNGIGVYGSQAGSGSGVYGETPTGAGVRGESHTDSGKGVVGNNDANGKGVEGGSNTGTGVWGASETGNGVFGGNITPGHWGWLGAPEAAVKARASSDTTAAVLIERGSVRVAGAGVGTTGPIFIHRATAGSISGHITTIDHPLANGDPNAILLVTHNYSVDSSATPYEPNTVGVWYNGSKWTIYHENTSVAMPVGRAFNVMIIKP